MLQEALKLIKEEAFDKTLRDRVKKLSGGIKKLKDPSTKARLAKAIDKVASQVEKHFNDPESRSYFNREWKQELKDLERQYRTEYNNQRGDYDSRDAYDEDDPKHPDFADREPRKMNESVKSKPALSGVIKKLEQMLKGMKEHVKWERNEEFEKMGPGAGKDHGKEIAHYERQISSLTNIIKQLKDIDSSNSSVKTEAVEIMQLIRESNAGMFHFKVKRGGKVIGELVVSGFEASDLNLNGTLGASGWEVNEEDIPKRVRSKIKPVSA